MRKLIAAAPAPSVELCREQANAARKAALAQFQRVEALRVRYAAALEAHKQQMPEYAAFLAGNATLHNLNRAHNAAVSAFRKAQNIA